MVLTDLFASRTDVAATGTVSVNYGLKVTHGGQLLGLFLPFLPKVRVLGHKSEVDSIECNETRQAGSLINYLFIGVSFILCDCYCDIII